MTFDVSSTEGCLHVVVVVDVVVVVVVVVVVLFISRLFLRIF